MKQLPAPLLTESTTQTPVFGTHFSMDVIRAHGQKILITREKLSQFTCTSLLDNETAECIKSALISHVIELIPSEGATIQVDCATSFQTLSNECAKDGTILKELNLKIDLGRTLNKNKNPIAENAAKEFHKERLRLDPIGGPVTPTQLAIITKNINSRIRERNLSPKEIVFKRDQSSNIPKHMDDDVVLSEKQYESRVKRHNQYTHEPPIDYKIGDNVFITHDKSKLRGRQIYKVVNTYFKDNEPWATLQKADTQFRAKSYEVKTSEIVPIPGPLTNKEINKQQKRRGGQLDVSKTGFVDQPKSSRADNPKSNQGTHSHPELIGNPKPRKKRKAALKCEENNGLLISHGLMRLNAEHQKKNKQVPTHAWDWNEFDLLCQSQSDLNVREVKDQKSLPRARVNQDLIDFSSDGLDQFWDNSLEQYQLTESWNTRDDEWSSLEDDSFSFLQTQLPTYSHDNPPTISDSHPPDNSDSCPPDNTHNSLSGSRPRLQATSSFTGVPNPDELTSEDSHDEIFPSEDTTRITRSAFKRQLETRKRRWRNFQPALRVNTEVSRAPAMGKLPCPVSPHDVDNNSTQLLSNVLPRAAPPVPEAVDLDGMRALRLSRAMPNLDTNSNANELDPLPYFRRQRRVNYMVFYNSKRKQGDGWRR